MLKILWESISAISDPTKRSESRRVARSSCPWVMGQLSNTDKKSARSLLNCEFGLVFQMCQKLFLFGSKGILSRGNRIGFWSDLGNWQCFPQKYFFQMFHYIVPRYKGSMKITRSHLPSHCFGHSNSFLFLNDALFGCRLISF